MNIAGKGSVSAIQSRKAPYAWRKMFQFRIRTLLIAMLILPTGFGLYANRRRDSQKAWNHYYAVQKYSHLAKMPPKIRQHSWLTHLGLDMPPIDDGLALWIPMSEEELDQEEIFRHVAELDALSSLAVSSVEISRGSLVPLQRLEKLQELELDGTYIDQDGLKEIAKLTQIRSLSLHLEGIMKSEMIDEDLHFLAEMPSVESLQFRFGGLARSEVFEAIAKAPSLKKLTLSHVTQYFANGSPYAKDLLQNGQLHEDDLADEGLSHLARNPHLETLHLQSTNFTGKGMQAIGKLSKLETLSIDSQLLGDEDLQHLRPLRNLKTLRLKCPQLTGECLSCVADLPGLRSLRMSARSVACEDLVQLRKMTKLQSLELSEVDTNDELVQAISEMPELQKLCFYSANLTDEQLLQLLESASLTEVIITSSLVTPAGEKAARKKKPKLDITIS